MTEAMENAESIFGTMSDYDISAFIKAKLSERLDVLRDEYGMDYGSNFLEQVAVHLLYLCNQYASDNSL